MSRRKRTGPFEDSDSEEQDGSSTQSSAVGNLSIYHFRLLLTSTQRKRRRGNIGSPIVSSPLSDENPQSSPTTPPSDVEDDSEDDEAIYQATQQRTQRRAEDNEAAEYGVLSSVHVVNFMCHQNEKWDLSPHINFVCGKNGSGKSAILTAIVLCLGGKASATNRGSALKDFIRHGASSAMVTCHLKNEGSNAFKRDEYGSTISIERNWTATSSGFKIRNANGKAMSTKKGELDEILDHFCLQMENPLNVLSQDNARSFISTSNAAAKYKFFLKGVLLEQLDGDYGIIEETVNNMAPKLERGDEDVKEKKRLWQIADQKLKDSRAQDGLRARVEELRHQCLWAQVQDSETLRDKLRDEIVKMEEKIASEQVRADSCSERIEQARAEVETKKADLDAVNTRVDDAKSEKAAADDKAKETNNEVREKRSERKNIARDLKQQRNDVDSCKQALNAEERRLAELDGGGAARRIRELDELRTEAEAATNALDRHRHAKAGLVKDCEDAKEAVDKAQEEYDAQKQRFDDRKNELQRAMQQESGQDTKFHDKMPALLAAMAKTQFRERPIGPIGKHIKLLHSDWSYILETIFGNTLSGFVVSYKDDQTSLLNLARKYGVYNLRVMMVPKRPLDVRSKEPDDSFLTILRALEIDDDQVRNLLIIQHRIESSILVSDFSEAQRIMNKTSLGQRARNVQSCFTFSEQNKRRGHVLSFKNGLPAQDAVYEYRGQLRINTNMDDQIRLYQSNVQEEQSRLDGTRSHLDACKNTLRRAAQTLKQHNSDDNKLRTEKQGAEQSMEDKQAEIDDDQTARGALEQLRENLRRAEQQVETTATLYGDGQIALDSANEAHGVSQAAVEKADERLTALQEQVDSARLVAQQADKAVATLMNERNVIANRITDLEGSKASFTRPLREAEEEVDSFSAAARRLGSERVAIPEGETYDTVDAKYTKLHDQLTESEQRVGGTPEEIQERANNALASYDTAKKDYEGLNAIRNGLVASVRERKRRWKFFRQMIGRAARGSFIQLLSQRGFRGKLILDHGQHLLDLRVEPDITKRDASGRGARTLSGGEKSFSQIW